MPCMGQNKEIVGSWLIFWRLYELSFSKSTMEVLLSTTGSINTSSYLLCYPLIYSERWEPENNCSRAIWSRTGTTSIVTAILTLEMHWSGGCIPGNQTARTACPCRNAVVAELWTLKWKEKVTPSKRKVTSSLGDASKSFRTFKPTLFYKVTSKIHVCILRKFAL